MATALANIPQFRIHLDGTRYALYVKSSDNPYYDCMFWLENWYCETFDVSKSIWVRNAAAQISKDRMEGVPFKRNTGPRTDWERNALWMVRVDRWQRKLRLYGAKRKPRCYSMKAACLKVSEELKKEGKFVEWTAIRSACDRAKERFELRYAGDDQFLKLGISNSREHVPLHLPSTYSLPTYCAAPPTPTNFQP